MSSQRRVVFLGQYLLQDPPSLPTVSHSVRGNHDDSSLHRWSSWREGGKELKANHAWVKDLQPRHVEALEALPFTLTLPDYGITVVSTRRSVPRLP